MKLFTPKHHSLIDWDLQPGSLLYLDDYTFISEPYSLACPSKDTGYYEAGWCFLGEALGKNIPHGKLITWLWLGHSATSVPRLMFRAQALPSPPEVSMYPDNCYYLQTTSTWYGLWKRVDGYSVCIDSGSGYPPLTEREWHKVALTWETIELAVGVFMAVLFEVYKDEQWQPWFLYLDDYNLWEESEVNRVGFRLAGAGDHKVRNSRVDDTEIWERLAPPPPFIELERLIVASPDDI